MTTSPLSCRERVQTALDHREPDRVPVAIGGGPYGIVDPVYFQLLALLHLGGPVSPFRRGHSISYMDDRLLERLGSDLRYVYPGASPNSPSQATDDPDTFLDSFGQVWKRAVPYFYAAKGMLSMATRLEQIDELVHWPEVNDPRWTAGVRQRARHLRETTDCWIVARMVASHGPYQTACDLRGAEEFMLDMATDPDFALALLERITNTLVGLTQGYLEACGSDIDMIELPGDDYAGNTNLVISPAMFRRFIQPALRKMVNTIKSFRPEIKVMLHSDGAIVRLLPDLIDLGIDVIHPLEPLPANDLAAIKALYGQRISFLGGIDISHAMPGTRQQVIDEVRLRIQQLAAGGGYILAPSNHLQADVPAENIVALFEAAQRYGKYPLQV
jgi:uroporphyrinogen decarboxylase